MARFDSPEGAQGRRIGRYEVLGEIASGGMATVYLARSMGAKGFSRLVAIKRLHPHLEAEEDFVQMFLDEARLAARIRHPNVVATLDVEDAEGLYIVMEYIEGVTLLTLSRTAQKLNEKIPVPVVARIVLDTLGGLQAAHELLDDNGDFLGLVHRDVSPQNILVGTDGSSRLTDFGIAKATSRLTMTRDGQLKGKISYMAPEQTKRVEIDRRVDLFAMGICAWELLAGKRLFQGDSDVEVLNQLLFEPIQRLKDHAPSIPAALEQAVMKALERDPTQRYASASEFGDAIEKAVRVLGGPANHRAVSSFVQKVAGERIARERGRIASGAAPSEMGTGSWKAVDAPPVTPSRVRSTGDAPVGRSTIQGTGLGARPTAPLSQGRYAVPSEGSQPRPKVPEAAPTPRPRAPTLAGAPIARRPPPTPTPSSVPPPRPSTPPSVRPPAAPMRSKSQTILGTGGARSNAPQPTAARPNAFASAFDPEMPTVESSAFNPSVEPVEEHEFEAPAPGEATLIEASPEAFIARHLQMSGRGPAPQESVSEELDPEPDDAFNAAPTNPPPKGVPAPTPSVPATMAMPAAPPSTAAPSFAPLPLESIPQSAPGPSLGAAPAAGASGAWSLGAGAPAQPGWNVSAPPPAFVPAPEAKPAGGGRGVLIGVAVVALLATGAVIAWTQLRGGSQNAPVSSAPQAAPAPPAPVPPAPAPPQNVPTPPSPEPVAAVDAGAAAVAVVDAGAPSVPPEPAVPTPVAEPTPPAPAAPEPALAPPAAPPRAERPSGEERGNRHRRHRDPDELEISPLVRQLPPPTSDDAPTRAAPAPAPTPAPQRAAPRHDPDPDAPDLGNPYRN